MLCPASAFSAKDFARSCSGDGSFVDGQHMATGNPGHLDPELSSPKRLTQELYQRRAPLQLCSGWACESASFVKGSWGSFISLGVLGPKP